MFAMCTNRRQFHFFTYITNSITCIHVCINIIYGRRRHTTHNAHTFTITIKRHMQHAAYSTYTVYSTRSCRQRACYTIYTIHDNDMDMDDVTWRTIFDI